jgi:hypothetical protein
MTTQLFHAAVPGGPTGISFQIGETTLFAPVEDEAIYIVQPSQLLVSAPVAPGMADFLAETVLAPRFERMGGAL